MERIAPRDFLYSTRILQIKGIYNYELARHVQTLSKNLS